MRKVVLDTSMIVCVLASVSTSFHLSPFNLFFFVENKHGNTLHYTTECKSSLSANGRPPHCVEPAYTFCFLHTRYLVRKIACMQVNVELALLRGLALVDLKC